MAKQRSRDRFDFLRARKDTYFQGVIVVFVDEWRTFFKKVRNESAPTAENHSEGSAMFFIQIRSGYREFDSL
ncbi:MAG: hypothetical protein ACOCV2_03930 [Persicimonas sp.]